MIGIEGRVGHGSSGGGVGSDTIFKETPGRGDDQEVMAAGVNAAGDSDGHIIPVAASLAFQIDLHGALFVVWGASPPRIPSIILISIVVLCILRQLIVHSQQKVIPVVAHRDRSVGNDDMEGGGSLLSSWEEHIHSIPLTHVIVFIVLP